MLVKNPVIFAVSIYIALVLGYAYILFITFSVVFQQQYGFSQGSTGLLYLGIGLGMLVSLAWMSRYSDRIFASRERKAGVYKPEYVGPILLLIFLVFFYSLLAL